VFEQKTQLNSLGVILQNTERSIWTQPRPRGVAELAMTNHSPLTCESFPGLQLGSINISYPNYSKNQQNPLLLLTQKDTPWEWGEESENERLRHLKTLMCRRPCASSAKLQQTICRPHQCFGLWRGCHTLTGGEKYPRMLKHPSHYFHPP